MDWIGIRDGVVGVVGFFTITALLSLIWYVFFKPSADKIITPENRKRIIDVICVLLVGGFLWYIFFNESFTWLISLLSN